MSDSSEDEDLSRFKDIVDNSFTATTVAKKENTTNVNIKLNNGYANNVKPKSERYLEEASHYNDVKVPEHMQRQIGAKIAAIINRTIEFIDVEQDERKKKHKIKGGVKLFRTSSGFLTSEDVEDTATLIHNMEAKKIKKEKRQIDKDENVLNEDDKIDLSVVSGDHIISKEDTKHWKSRRKEKVFKYKKHKKSKVLTLVE